jgi:hypothetical protein
MLLWRHKKRKKKRRVKLLNPSFSPKSFLRRLKSKSLSRSLRMTALQLKRHVDRKRIGKFRRRKSRCTTYLHVGEEEAEDVEES